MNASTWAHVGLTVAEGLLVAGLICAVWAVVEWVVTWAKTRAARRRRAARAERRAAIAAARIDQPPSPAAIDQPASPAVEPSPAAQWARLMVDDDYMRDRFEAIVHRHPILSSRLTQLAAGIEPEKEQQS